MRSYSVSFPCNPVTGLAAGMYAALLAATWRPTRPVYAILAISFAGAALWFYSIYFPARAIGTTVGVFKAIGVK